MRVVTATSLFDGHDAAIHVMRRILQSQGAEVIHLGHDRSVEQLVRAALQEDADAVALSSYQGGHMETFRYLVDELRRHGAGHVRVYGGGGGTILPGEIAELQAHGVARIFSPEDGRALGLVPMIKTILAECAAAFEPPFDPDAVLAQISPSAHRPLGRMISRLEDMPKGPEADALREKLRARITRRTPVLGVTGTGGAGKSTVVDELVRRLRRDAPSASIGMLLVDPTRRRSGGALLGDRLRMNAIHGERIYVRSLATRAAHRALSTAVEDAVLALQAAGFDLIVIETAGIGQGDSAIADLADVPVYVMTPDYGAPSQLEKIDMLELADVVIVNKSDRQGGADALRDVRKQWKRNQQTFDAADDTLPVVATIASQWSDPGMERAYQLVRERLFVEGAELLGSSAAPEPSSAAAIEIVPRARVRYLAEIATAVRDYHARTAELCEHAADAEAYARALHALHALHELSNRDGTDPSLEALRARHAEAQAALPDELRQTLLDWPQTLARYEAPTQSYEVRGQAIHVDNHVPSLAGSALPRVALPTFESARELTRYLRGENLPGRFPFTAGVFPFKREGELPGRMFAGEGGPERTNRRFHLLSRGQPAVRLSTAFDSVTLYGRDPDPRPDVFGKVGNSGVSVCTVDDAKRLYSGFDLVDPKTSVSMTINGPAPTVLAFYFNAAIDQQVERHLRERGELESVRARFAAERGALPEYRASLPQGHDGLGLGLLGIPGALAVDAATYARIASGVLASLRGTVQADILKEDQAQNTCIFSTAFSLRAMGDVQAYFLRHRVRNFYSVSVSGYHIAEAGANPITQLAFTLANGFTYVEHYLSRGMKVDDFAPNLSFFFSSSLDAESSVLGRVGRRIWAIAMRDVYGAGERSQMLKYHSQTSGRSLHAQEMSFNDIRTTLQALSALFDGASSLHTNAYDEAVTTPTEESVRRALAIQLIIQKELGLARTDNALQGSYAIERLTELVERAVLDELDRLSERGGVLGAMELLYQRSKIQEESLHYESLKHSGELPLVGVNTFENPDPAVATQRPAELARSTDAEKQAQLAVLRAFHTRWAPDSEAALHALATAARRGDNVFEALMQAVRYASLGQITEALFEVGGAYRRAM